MRIARFATWTCALAVVLMAGAATVARADAAPSASAAELKDALCKGAHHRNPGQWRSRRRAHRYRQRRSRRRCQGRPHPGRRRQPSGPEQNRDQLRLDPGHRLPGHVHAGRFRDGRSRSMPREERKPHLHDELLRVCVRVVRLLDHRLRHPDGRCRRKRKSGRPAIAEHRAHAYAVRHHIGASSASAACSSPGTPMTSASWSSSCSRWCSWIRP